MSGKDVSKMMEKVGRFYIYFSNPVCPGTVSPVHLAGKGENIMIISMRTDFDAIDRLLGKTRFGQHPYYAIAGEDYSDLLLRRKIMFIKDACATCYELYMDDVNWVDLLLLKNGIITPVFYNDTTGINILKP